MQPNNNNLTLQIITGIVIGGGMLYALIAAGNYLINPVKRIEAVEDRLQITSTVVGNAVGKVVDIVNERQLNAQRERARIEVEKQRQLEEIRLAKKAEDEAKAKKDAMFKKYYKKPERCYGKKSQEETVKCANEYIKARAKFEEIDIN